MKDELVYIPIERVEFIRDGVDGLRSFLATGNWRDPNWHRAVLLHRADAGGWYVFSNIEFRAFATRSFGNESHSAGLDRGATAAPLRR